MGLPEELKRARWLVSKTSPFLAPGLWAMEMVERPGLGSFAVDSRWRMYYDRECFARWNPEELAGVLCHELWHLVRGHAGRLSTFDPTSANIAADCEINDDVIKQYKMPKGVLLPSSYGWPPGKMAEWYIGQMQKKAQQAAESCDEQEESPDEDGENEASGGSDQDQDADAADGDDGGGPGDGKEDADADANAEGDGGGPTCDEPSEDGASAGGGTPSQDAPAPGTGRCGSAATGTPEPWEIDDDDAAWPDTPKGIDPTRQESIRRQIAQEIMKEAAKGCGNIPGGAERWAKDKLRVKPIPWQRLFGGAIRASVREASGLSFTTYRRPSRRAVAGLLRGDTIRPVPDVAAVIDTSGSMNQTDLASAIATMAQAVKALGVPMRVLSCDMAASVAKKITRAGQIELFGGGGTDMGIGIAAAAELRPKPAVIVVVTDGETGWPSQPPPGIRVVVATTRAMGPTWARNIRIQAVDAE